MTTSQPAARLVLSKVEFIALMAMLMALNALSNNVMLPALPQIGASLGVENENMRQLVVSAYLAGMACSLLPFGPAADAFGRRKPLLFGLAVYIGASLAAIFVTSFEVLLALRFIQGLGAAAARVIALSVIRDRFQGKEMAGAMSLVMTVFMIVPVLSPLLGQGIMLFGDWHLTFVWMTGAGIVVTTWLATRLSETLPPGQRRPFTLASIGGAVVAVLGNRAAACYILVSTVMFGALYAYIASAQQVFVDLYGLGGWFPTVYAGISGMMAVASLLNARLVARFSVLRLTHATLLGFLAVSALWLILAMLGAASLAVTIVCSTLAMAQFGLIVSNLNALVMTPLGRVAGAAAAIQSFMQTAGGAVIGAAIGLAFDGTVVPLATGFVLIGGLGLLFTLIAEGGRLFGASPEDQVPVEGMGGGEEGTRPRKPGNARFPGLSDCPATRCLYQRIVPGSRHFWWSQRQHIMFTDDTLDVCLHRMIYHAF